jgi:hypothetical protein
MPDFYFYSYLSFLSLLFCLEFQKKKIMKIKNKKKIRKMFFFFFFLCMFFSVCPAAGCRWRGHQIHTRTGQRETHQNRFSDNVISSQRESPAVYTHKATNMLGFLFFFSFSPISLFFETFLVCSFSFQVRPQQRLSMSGDGSFSFFCFYHCINIAFLFLCGGEKEIEDETHLVGHSTPRWP